MDLDGKNLDGGVAKAKNSPPTKNTSATGTPLAGFTLPPGEEWRLASISGSEPLPNITPSPEVSRWIQKSLVPTCALLDQMGFVVLDPLVQALSTAPSIVSKNVDKICEQVQSEVRKVTRQDGLFDVYSAQLEKRARMCKVLNRFLLTCGSVLTVERDDRIHSHTIKAITEISVTPYTAKVFDLVPNRPLEGLPRGCFYQLLNLSTLFSGQAGREVTQLESYFLSGAKNGQEQGDKHTGHPLAVGLATGAAAYYPAYPKESLLNNIILATRLEEGFHAIDFTLILSHLGRFSSTGSSDAVSDWRAIRAASLSALVKREGPLGKLLYREARTPFDYQHAYGLVVELAAHFAIAIHQPKLGYLPYQWIRDLATAEAAVDPNRPGLDAETLGCVLTPQSGIGLAAFLVAEGKSPGSINLDDPRTLRRLLNEAQRFLKMSISDPASFGAIAKEARNASFHSHYDPSVATISTLSLPKMSP